jgi:crotonobetainyl-CoA:carnitine CoA-transferase CaiB-like acyl-CoA transferase
MSTTGNPTAMARIRSLAEQLDVTAERVTVTASDDPFGSPYQVAEAAVASIGVALASVAALDEQRSGRAAEVLLDGRHAAAAFQSERFLRLGSGDEPDLWDPIAGNYPTADGWIRLHTNLPHHRDAVVGVLGVEPERAAVAAAAARWPSEELETTVIAAGGVAARMRTVEEWLRHPQRAAVLRRPLVDLVTTGRADGPPARLRAGRVLDGVRVLDLSRVIAGPVAGRFLASFGADVIRVDPPLEDGSLLEIETGAGKRRTSIDLRKQGDRRRFEELVSGADVLLEGFRPGALADIGYPDPRLRARNPSLVIGHLAAFSDRGPWAARRGFDSIVQVATGMAHRCGFDPTTGPGKLPAQALDHASGYLLAAGLVAGLARRVQESEASTVRVSLARTGAWLTDLGTRDRPMGSSVPAVPDLLDRWPGTAWGTVEQLRPVGRVADRPAAWPGPATPRTGGPISWLDR